MYTQPLPSRGAVTKKNNIANTHFDVLQKKKKGGEGGRTKNSNMKTYIIQQ